MTLAPVSDKRHRFPPEIIAHAVWLYFRVPLSLRFVEEMLFERGILVSYETVRRWALKFGQDYVRRLKPKRIVTDKLASYAAARREIMPTVEHRSHKSLNNRAENSHLPVRRRECAMQDLRSPGGMQRFVATVSAVRNHFVPPRSRRSALSPPTSIEYAPWPNGKP